MNDIPQISELVQVGHELIDDYRGGAIARMKAEHEQTLEELEANKQTALNQFNDEKNQKLNEFNNQKTSALNDLASRANNVINNVNSHLASSRDRQTHLRLTKNQMLSSDDGAFPSSWSNGGATIKATLLETVRNGVQPSDRSVLATEFLDAINSNNAYFNSMFHIWELEIEQSESGRDYLPWQYVTLSQAITVAAIVKHISGPVPYGRYCQGLKAGEPAKLCGQLVQYTNYRNGYVNIHPYLDSGSDKAIIQIALPAAVTGEVDLSNGAWGQFPYIGN